MATENMTVYCFDALIYHFDKKTLYSPSFPNHSYPLFVTWKKQAKKDGEIRLRGCIGTFSPQPIHNGLKEYSLTSALNDKRFSPMQQHEIPQLHCGVSLLTNFEPATHWYDWEVGKHGINIDFVDPVAGKKRHATYLPEVAREQGWNHAETIDSLMAKAGFSGSVTDVMRRSVVVERYQSSKADITYDAYHAHIANRQA